MGIREELNEALPADDFPSSSLLAQTLIRLDEPAPAAKRWQAAAGVAAVLLAGVVVGAIRFAHVGHRPVQPAATSQPVATGPSAAQEGLLNYRFVSAQVGWVSVFRPDGRTVVAKTTDGGRHWQHQLQIDGVFPSFPAFINSSVAILGGQPQGFPPTTFPPTIWITTDGGAHWDMRKAPVDSGDLLSFDFIDPTHGWLRTHQGSLAFLYRTIDGGRQWTRVASSDTTAALTMSEVWTQLKFVSPTVGWIATSPNRYGSYDLYATRDGGRTWGLESRPAAGIGVPAGTRMTIDLPAFLDDHDGTVVMSVSSSSPTPCPSPAPSSSTLTCFQPVATYVSKTRDGGQSWSPPRRVTVDGTLSFIDAHQWIARSANGISTSVDSGVSWSAPRPFPQLPTGWSPNQIQLLDLSLGWLSTGDWPDAQRIAVFGTSVQGSTQPMHIRISGTVPQFALLSTDDGGVHWREVQLAGID